MSLLTESGSIRRDNVRTRHDCGNFQSCSSARSAMTEPNFVILYVNDAIDGNGLRTHIRRTRS
ncbi:MAG TPA: hypothetical protein VFJ48_06275 [Casimicrobiaceae bacterium]|nr:hypothetical protein [Casimicrobiaceae bacterium]